MKTVRLLTLGWAILVLAGLALVAALSAHAAWRAVEAHPVAEQLIPTISTGYEAEDHFPGAALLYADLPQPTANAAPAAGVTGTADLPALPVSAEQAAAIVAANVGVVPAQPFAMRGIGGIDRARALECLTAAIYYEAASEPDAGQSAVAQVILNRVRHPAFPGTVCGVVYQGSEHAGCQFSFACDGALLRIPNRAAWNRASRAAGMALAGYVYAPVGLATHYHTYAVTPAWNRSLVMTDVVGAHFFHRWKGFWGTAAAFRQVYRGAEPLPGPHARIILDAPVIAMPMPLGETAPSLATASPTIVANTAVPPTALTPPSQIKPAYADSGTYLTPVPKADDATGDSQILDRWKDSGKPLK